MSSAINAGLPLFYRVCGRQAACVLFGDQSSGAAGSAPAGTSGAQPPISHPRTPLAAPGCCWLLLNRDIEKKHMLFFTLLIAATCCLLLNKDTVKGSHNALNLIRPSLHQMQSNLVQVSEFPLLPQITSLYVIQFHNIHVVSSLILLKWLVHHTSALLYLSLFHPPSLAAISLHSVLFFFTSYMFADIFDTAECCFRLTQMNLLRCCLRGFQVWK